MGRLFSISFTDIAVTAVQDFLSVAPLTGRNCRVVALGLTQASDVGDAAEEILSVSLIRVTGTTAQPSGGASVTPEPIDYIGVKATANFVARRNDTTVGTGTLATCMPFQFNIRTGLEVWFPPECRFQAIQGDTTNEIGIVLRLNVAPADSLTMSGWMIVEEE